MTEIKVGDVWKRKNDYGPNGEERKIIAVHGRNVAFAIRPDDNILRVCAKKVILDNFELIERDGVKRPGPNEWATLQQIVDFGIATEEDARKRWLELHDDGEVAQFNNEPWHDKSIPQNPIGCGLLFDYRLKLDSRGMMPEVPVKEAPKPVEDPYRIERQRKSAETIIAQGGSCKNVECTSCPGKDVECYEDRDYWCERLKIMTEWLAAHPKSEPQLMICNNADKCGEIADCLHGEKHDHSSACVGFCTNSNSPKLSTCIPYVAPEEEKAEEKYERAVVIECANGDRTVYRPGRMYQKIDALKERIIGYQFEGIDEICATEKAYYSEELGLLAVVDMAQLNSGAVVPARLVSVVMKREG